MCVLERAWVVLKTLLIGLWVMKGILVWAQKEKRRAVEKASVNLEYTYIIMNEVL